MVVLLITTGMLALAAYFDYRGLIIPNWLQVVAVISVGLSIVLFDPHSWKVRLFTALLLTVLYFVAWLLKQSGGGDLKMMLWFGAGYGLTGFGILFAGSICMVIWAVGMKIARGKIQPIPLAPCLIIGLILLEVVSRRFV